MVNIFDIENDSNTVPNLVSIKSTVLQNLKDNIWI